MAQRAGSLGVDASNGADVEKQPLLKLQSSGGSGAGAADSSLVRPGFIGAALAAGFSMTTIIIIYYAICSSTMLVINKVAIEMIPAPSFVMFCQMAFSAGVARAGGALGLVEVDELEWGKTQKFMLVVMGFLGCIFCNMKVLQNSNVETFITFRSSTPLILSFCDYWFLGRALPSLRSWGCLVVLLLGSIGYVFTDTSFKVQAYVWLMAWYSFFIFDCVYVKHTVDTVKMTNWGRVYYTNFLTLPFLLFMMLLLGESDRLGRVTWHASAFVPLLLSCVVGVGMSHASYLLREACSATLFTVVGIICKVITVIINWMIWDKHATLEGIGFLMLCVLAGTFYQQAPKRLT